jgi:hypothetical protein
MIAKEFRALLPVWTVCAAGLLATMADLPLPIRSAGAAVYIIACAALGALAFGHEYSHGTMPLLLSQPIARRRIYLVKLGVVTILLFALRAVLWIIPFPEGSSAFGPLLIALPLLSAVLIAPWLTLVTESPLAGAIFSLSLAAVVLIVSERLAGGGMGITEAADPLKISLIRWSMLALSAIGAVMGWRTFVRLELAGSSRRPLFRRRRRETAAVPARAAVRRAPVWLLAAKELRLQYMSILVAGLYVAIYLLTAARRDPLVDRSDAVTIIALIHVVVVSLLIGSLASAEERQLGTLDWQLLLPPSAARQWVVKIGTVLALTALLGIVLPRVLAWLVPAAPGPWRHGIAAFRPEAALLALICVASSLYVSSLVSTGVRALITSTTALLACGVFMRTIEWPLRHAIPLEWRLPGGFDDERAVTAAIVLGALALLRLALSNHRTLDHGWQRVATQAGWIAAALIGVVATSIVAGP